MIDLSIIIVSWNTRDLLSDCLETILADPHLFEKAAVEIIVVDNLSSDGTPQLLRYRYPSVKLIEMGENTGFSRGNNIGIKASQGTYLYLLNPDTKPLPDSTLLQLEYLRGHADTAITGPKLLNADGSIQSSRRRFPNRWTAIFESTWLEPFAPARIIEHFRLNDLPDDKLQEVDWLSGAALMVRRDVVNEIGFLDETFFMYSEELDWQKRIKEAGWKIVFLPDAEVVHYGGKSSEQVIAKQHIFFQTSKIHYYEKHDSPHFARILRSVLLAQYHIQWFVEALKLVLGHNKKLRRGRMTAYREVIASGLRVTKK